MNKEVLRSALRSAAHKVADAQRAAVRNRSDLIAKMPNPPTLGDHPEVRVTQAELATQMEQLMAALTPERREILRLRIVRGVSAKKTAEAIRKEQRRALNQLRRALNKGLVRLGSGINLHRVGMQMQGEIHKKLRSAATDHRPTESS